MMPERRIVYQTANLYAYRVASDRLEIRLHTLTHSLAVGSVATIEHARRFMDRAERYPERLRAFMGAV